MKQYYIPYEANIDVNYIYVLLFYSIAEYNAKSKRFDVVKYTTQRDLTEKLNSKLKDYGRTISAATVSRILNDERYSKFFQRDDNKQITIQNDIKGCSSFVVLNEKEVDLILRENDILLAKYLLYLKYYCGYSKSKSIDTTTKQFLAAVGYSERSGKYISKVSELNKILSDSGFITIKKVRDTDGHERNIYAYNSMAASH